MCLELQEEEGAWWGGWEVKSEQPGKKGAGEQVGGFCEDGPEAPGSYPRLKWEAAWGF